MHTGKDFPPADVNESELYCFDFVNDLRAGHTIASAVWTCTVAAISEADDPDAASRLIDDPLLQDRQPTKTFHRVAGLQPGVTYRLQAVATTQLGDRVTLWSHVKSGT